MTGAERLSQLPNWPYRLSEDAAALYLGISKSHFRGKWESGSYPQPVREGGRLFWCRAQLDRFVDDQFGLQQPSVPETGGRDDSWDDL